MVLPNSTVIAEGPSERAREVKVAGEIARIEATAAIAVAAFAPLPPLWVEGSAFVTVSPGFGRRSTLRTKSWFIDPSAKTSAITYWRNCDTFSFVTSFTGTGMFLSTDFPSTTFMAFSTPREPIFTALPARPPRARTAPMAISSFWAKMPLISGLDCRMFSVTFRPSVRRKLAVWLETSCTASWAFITSSKPCPLSRVGLVPGMPSSWATGPLPTSWISSFAAILPPSTLSEAMRVSSLPPEAPRSSAMTGMLAWFAAWTTGTTASESTGLIRIASTCWVTKFWTSSCCVAASSCASAIISFAPSFLAACWAPLRRVTKNGLFRVEIESPILGPPPSPPPPPRWQPTATTVARAARISSPRTAILFPISHSFLSLSPPQGVRHHREGYDSAYHHLLPECRDVQQVQAVSQNAEDERPDQGSRGGTHSTREARAPDHHRGDGVELVGKTRLGIRRGQPGGEQDARYAGEEPRERVDDQLLARDVYPRERGGLFVAADGVHAPARVGAPEYPDRECPHDDHQDHGQRHEAKEVAATQREDHTR